jgi:2-keto-4-pentenoate hydratase
VTTGSWTGATLGMAGSLVDVVFSSAGEVHLRFE